MPAPTETLSIQISPAMLDRIRRLVDQGGYASPTDFVQHAVEAWLQRQEPAIATESLRDLWLEARQDEAPGLPADAVFTRLDHKYRDLPDAAPPHAPIRQSA